LDCALHSTIALNVRRPARLSKVRLVSPNKPTIRLHDRRALVLDTIGDPRGGDKPPFRAALHELQFLPHP